MRQGCDHQVEVVLLEHDGLQVRLDATASQLFDSRNALTAEHEQLGRPRKRLASSNLQLESRLSSLNFCLVDGSLAWKPTSVLQIGQSLQVYSLQLWTAWRWTCSSLQRYCVRQHEG